MCSQHKTKFQAVLHMIPNTGHWGSHKAEEIDNASNCKLIIIYNQNNHMEL